MRRKCRLRREVFMTIGMLLGFIGITISIAGVFVESNQLFWIGMTPSGLGVGLTSLVGYFENLALEEDLRKGRDLYGD